MNDNNKALTCHTIRQEKCFDNTSFVCIYFNTNKLAGDIMDFISEQVEVFKKRKQSLMDEIKKLDKAINALMGIEEPMVKTDSTAKVAKKRPRWMAETIKIFNTRDYLDINDIQKTFIENGVEQAKGYKGRNAISTTLGRLCDRGALKKTSENKFYKTEQWQNKTGQSQSKFKRRKNSIQGVSEVAYKIMLEHGSRLHYVYLMELIQKKGVEIGGKEPKSTMSAHLSNDKRFKSLGGGEWTLLEWERGTDTGGNDEEVVSLVSANGTPDSDKPTLRLRRLHEPLEE